MATETGCQKQKGLSGISTEALNSLNRKEVALCRRHHLGNTLNTPISALTLTGARINTAEAMMPANLLWRFWLWNPRGFTVTCH